MSDFGPAPEGGDVNRGPSVTVCVTVLFTASLITTIVRMYVRKYIVRQIGWDDYTICVAMVRIGVFGVTR